MANKIILYPISYIPAILLLDIKIKEIIWTYEMYSQTSRAMFIIHNGHYPSKIWPDE